MIRYVERKQGWFKKPVMVAQILVEREYWSPMDIDDPRNGEKYNAWVDATPEDIIKVQTKEVLSIIEGYETSLHEKLKFLSPTCNEYVQVKGILLGYKSTKILLEAHLCK